MSIHNKISAADIERVYNPIDKAGGLPNAAYVDQDVFAFERDNLMANTWAGLLFASELPENGYALPIDFMGLPLLAIRDREGQLSIFHNVCSHRGMILVREAGPVKNLLRCPYHSWSYTLDGELKSTPHIGGVGQNSAEGFSCIGKGLKPVRSAEWMGIVFVNLSGEAESFDDFIEPLDARWAKFAGAGALNKLSVASDHSQMQLEIKANWKLAIENYCEAYHLPWVHPELNSYSPLDQHENLHVNDYMTGQATHNYTLSEVAGTTLPKFGAWPQDKQAYGEYISLYPNLMLGVQVDHAFAIILQPIAPNHTIEKLQIAYVDDDAISDQYQGCRDATLAAWKTVFTEDIFAVEGMQKGRHSPGFQGGVFSPVLDTPSHDFHKWVAKAYQSGIESKA